MKSACYVQETCDRCRDKVDLLVNPGGYPVSPRWIATWGIYRVSRSEIIQDPEGRCVGCRSVRFNMLKVIPSFLHRLGVCFELDPDKRDDSAYIGFGAGMLSFGHIRPVRRVG